MSSLDRLSFMIHDIHHNTALFQEHSRKLHPPFIQIGMPICICRWGRKSPWCQYV